jgi:hypothetical protein
MQTVFILTEPDGSRKHMTGSRPVNMQWWSVCGDASGLTVKVGWPSEVDCVNCRKTEAYHDTIRDENAG